MEQQFDAIYENGIIRPLGPVELTEHQRLSVIVQSTGADPLLDHDAMEWARREGDPTIPLDEVRKLLAKIPGSLSDLVIAERGEY